MSGVCHKCGADVPTDAHGPWARCPGCGVYPWGREKHEAEVALRKIWDILIALPPSSQRSIADVIARRYNVQGVSPAGALGFMALGALVGDILANVTTKPEPVVATAEPWKMKFGDVVTVGSSDGDKGGDGAPLLLPAPREDET